MKTKNSQYKINVAATPIGNIQEVNQRFLEAVTTMDVLLCEDTRVTKKLLMLLNIHKTFEYIKFDMFSELTNNDYIIDLIKSNKNVMLLSDAGYPTISDPGYKLINTCIQHKIAINVINGPCSLIHALVGSGFSSREFLFLGFLGKNSTDRIKKINQYKNVDTTWIILESVHRLNQCLEDLYKVLGPQNICIARELTKLHEEFIYCNLSEFNNLQFDCKGEFVLVIEKKDIKTSVSNEQIEFEIKELLKTKIKTKDISNMVAKKFNLNSKDIYKKVLEILHHENDMK